MQTRYHSHKALKNPWITLNRNLASAPFSANTSLHLTETVLPNWLSQAFVTMVTTVKCEFGLWPYDDLLSWIWERLDTDLRTG